MCAAPAELARSEALLRSLSTSEPAPGINNRASPQLTAWRSSRYRIGKPEYNTFISFVQNEFASQMDIELVREDFYPHLWHRWQDNKYTIDEIARGHGKTEWGIWNLLWNVIRQPLNRWWDMPGMKRITEQLIVSCGTTEVNEIGDRIEDYVFGSDLLNQLVPHGARKNELSSVWNKKKKVFTNGSILHFRPVKCKRGLHVDWIWLDDLITESSTLSDKETARFVQGVILPMGVAKRAPVRITGTPLRATDIIHVMDKTGKYDHVRLPAILDFPTKALLSRRFSWDSLMGIRSQQHPAKFEAEYMLNALEAETGVIRRTWVENSFDGTFDITNPSTKDWRKPYYAVYGGVDFAFADIQTADWSVYATIGDRGPESQGRRFDILELDRFQGKSLGWQMNFLREWHDRWNHDLIGMEANSIRGSVKEIRDLGMPVKLFWTGNRDEEEKLRPSEQEEYAGNIHTVSKRNFALRQGLQYEQGKVRIPYSSQRARDMADRLLLESVSWALEEQKLIEIGEHPDIPIALGYALEVALGHTFVVA